MLHQTAWTNPPVYTSLNLSLFPCLYFGLQGKMTFKTCMWTLKNLSKINRNAIAGFSIYANKKSNCSNDSQLYICIYLPWWQAGSAVQFFFFFFFFLSPSLNLNLAILAFSSTVVAYNFIQIFIHKFHGFSAPFAQLISTIYRPVYWYRIFVVVDFTHSMVCWLLNVPAPKLRIAGSNLLKLLYMIEVADQTFHITQSL